MLDQRGASPDALRNAILPGLSGRVALVTGGSKGMGAETARALAANGARLPDDVGQATFFLLSDAARYLPGVTLDIAGGRVML